VRRGAFSTEATCNCNQQRHQQQQQQQQQQQKLQTQQQHKQRKLQARQQHTSFLGVRARFKTRAKIARRLFFFLFFLFFSPSSVEIFAFSG